MRLALLLILMWGVVATAHAEFKQVCLSWDLPVERMDGSTLFPHEIRNFTIYEDGYAVLTPQGGATSECYVYERYGTPCYTISTTDTYGQEGEQSPEVCTNVFPDPPRAPTRLKLSS